MLRPTKAAVKQCMIESISEGRQNNKSNQRYTVKRIRPDLNSYYNSLNILTGAQGKGKTFSALSEIITISYLPETHLIVYVKKKDYDETVESIREMSNVKILDVNYATCQEAIKLIFEAKNEYNRLRREAIDKGYEFDEIDEHIDDKEALQELYDTLHINDFSRPWLNTIILFDDGGNSGLFARKDGYFNNIFKLLRDVNAIIYITIHGMTQLLPSIKENSAVVYIGKGLSHDRLAIIHRQTNNPIEYREFIYYYDRMNRDPSKHVLVVDNIEGVLRSE